MPRFMVVHRSPERSWGEVEKNWTKLAQVKLASWERTWFNKNEGVRYCLWDSLDAGTLEKIFNDLDITWESITEVEETVPDIWKAFRYTKSPFPGQIRLR
jgi:hypothetical protein